MKVDGLFKLDIEKMDNFLSKLNKLSFLAYDIGVELEELEEMKGEILKNIRDSKSEDELLDKFHELDFQLEEISITTHDLEFNVGEFQKILLDSVGYEINVDGKWIKS